MLLDSHCHLGDGAFDHDRPEVVARAWAEGLGHLVIIGESRAATELGLALARDEPRISVTAGVHPHDANTWKDDSAPWLRSMSAEPAMVALGEIGLDYHYDHSPRDVQREVFETQLGLAAELALPVVIHAREADDDMIAMLRDHPDVSAVMHSFSSSLALWQVAVALGHYISFSGMVTFRNWELDDAVRDTPLDRLLVETDAPYLAPVPLRGKRNEPAYVNHVAARVAEVRGEELGVLRDAVMANAGRLFGARIPAGEGSGEDAR